MAIVDKDNEKMWKRISVLFLVGLLLMQICCINSVYAQVITKTPLELALKDERTLSFIQQNKQLLDQIREQYDEIQVTIEGTGEIPYLIYKDNKRFGVYPQLIDFFAEITQIPCVVQDDKESVEELYDSVLEHKINVVFGITSKEEFVFSDKMQTVIEVNGVTLNRLDGSVFENPFVLAVPSKQNYTMMQLPYAFWGMTSEYESIIKETTLNGHTIGYNTYEEMKDAFKQNDIQGMFIPKSKLDYEIQFFHEKYHSLSTFGVEGREYFLSTDDSLISTITKVASLYEKLYDDYFYDEIVQVTTSLSETDTYTSSYWRFLFFIVIGIVLVIILMLVFKQYVRHQFEKMIATVEKNSRRKEDILFVNLKTKKIHSKLGFTFYGALVPHHKKTLAFKELTKRIGFDFKKYYEYIIARQETEFIHEFELYIQGVRYHYVENGVVQGRRIASRIYRKEL